ncbi:MAG: SDR family NAD(P)-dependent oxidoreductase, partial [Planctomycetota bacterium]|nr:SDR family NAD(P)-dependent oxidoreductase [Planctomycetota bacterium]
MRGLKGKVVIVTGAGQGIGRATALRFAEEGAHVAIAERNEESGQAVCQEIQALGAEALFVQSNVSDRSSVKALFDEVRKKWDKVDVLVNNAGIVKDSTLLKMQDDQFDAVIDVNLKGTFVCASEAAAIMKAQGSGVILNAASVVALYGNFGQSNYVASKTGVIGMTKVWSRELARYGIRVNAIAPGFIETAMTKSIP